MKKQYSAPSVEVTIFDSPEILKGSDSYIDVGE